MARLRKRFGFGLASVLLGCGSAQPVPPGSLAETQLHAPCPATGCAEPLSCVGGQEAADPTTCELACNGSCPLPLQCMARPDGQRGGMCAPPPARTRSFGN